MVGPAKVTGYAALQPVDELGAHGLIKAIFVCELVPGGAAEPGGALDTVEWIPRRKS
ncbi:hypothetical protein CVCC1112_2925 [Paenarthrobacter nicotinovorans]|nr:hypothetical protein CVCC1112_2925 [Paenarthrobacter nicotinovorans]